MPLARNVVALLLVAWLATTGCSNADTEEIDRAARLLETQLLTDPSVKSVERVEANRLHVLLNDGKEVDSYLDNISAELTSSDENPEAIAARYARIAVASAGASVAPIELDRIYPIVRNRSYIEQIAKTYGDNANLPAAIPLAADYMVLFALDSEESLRVLDESAFSDLAKTRDEILAIAIENLRRDLTPNAEIHGDGQINMIAMGGNYESSLLIDTEFWRSEAQRLNDSIVAVAMARDLLLYARKSDKDSISKMRKIVYDNQGTIVVLVSTQFLEWTGESWRSFSE